MMEIVVFLFLIPTEYREDRIKNVTMNEYISTDEEGRRFRKQFSKWNK